MCSICNLKRKDLELSLAHVLNVLHLTGELCLNSESTRKRSKSPGAGGEKRRLERQAVHGNIGRLS